MRAKKVNESQNFERGQGTKKALGLGGLNLEELLDERVEDLEMQLSMTKLTADEEWEEFLRKTLIGKKITSEMTKLPVVSMKGEKLGPMLGERITDEFTIIIQDVKSSSKLSEALGQFSTYLSLIIADSNKNLYELKIKDKIYFDES